MDQVIKLDLKVSGDEVIITTSPILPHEGKPYQTQAMVKGYEEIDGEKHNRRVYLNKLCVPYVFINLNELIETEYEYGHVFAWEKDLRKARVALLDKFRQDIEQTRNKVEDFLDHAPELIDSATNTMKYS